MIRKYVLTALAIGGIVLAILTVISGNRQAPVAAPVVQPPKAPFESYVAGAGIVEASTRNIAIGSPVAGLVMEVYVQAGDPVNAGQPLFNLDDRDLVAELAARKAALAAAESQLQKLRQQPRPEDIPPAEARVKAAEMTLADVQNQLRLWESVTDPRAISQEELDQRRYAVQVAQARLTEAISELQRLKAGAWQPDIAIAQAQVDSEQAQVQQTQTEIDRRSIRAPVDGQVLQRNVEPGEFASITPSESTLMLLGSIQELHVRVDVDENDAWRVRPEGRAIAFLRGNPRYKADLQFVRFEPYIIPKRSLTGASTERVDTRVLQVIYRLKAGDMPVYVGQLMDVMIEAPSVDDAQSPADSPNARRTTEGAISE